MTKLRHWNQRMTETSINGWQASKILDVIRIRTFTVPGTTRRVQLCTEAAPILLWVGGQFHKLVANLDDEPLAVWGYNYRKARQADALSDHASGTAIDLRSDKFPIGKRNMTLKQKWRVRQILKACNGLVIWGGNYKSLRSADEMHFAIAPNVTPRDIMLWQATNKVNAYGIVVKPTT